jgi:hypothetical protein
MPIPSRPHPLWNDLRLQPDEAREVNGQLLRFRDLALKDDPKHGGIPDLFRPWAVQNLKRLCKDNPWYKSQTESMIGKLLENVEKLQKERSDLEASYDMRIEQASLEIDELLSALPERESSDALPVVVTE